MLGHKKYYSLVMKEELVTTVISVINNATGNYKFSVGNCGWANEKDMWFVHFYSTKKNYETIMTELSKIGSFKQDGCHTYFIKSM